MRNKIVGIVGCSDSRAAQAIAEQLETGRQALIITAGRARAERLSSDLSFFCDRNVLTVPADEHIFLGYRARSREDQVERLKAIKALRTDPEAVVVVPASAACRRMPPHDSFDSSTLQLKVGEEFDPERLKNALTEMGYERTGMAAARGQFSARGGIVDVYCPDREDPFRIEFFGTEVDSIRVFDAESQRSLENLSRIEIFPAVSISGSERILKQAVRRIDLYYDRQMRKIEQRPGTEDTVKRLRERRDELKEYAENLDNTELMESFVHYFYDDTEYLWDYMTNGVIFCEDPVRIEETLNLRARDAENDLQVMIERGQAVPEDAALLTGKEDFRGIYNRPEVYVLLPFAQSVPGLTGFSSLIEKNGRQMIGFGGHIDVLAREIERKLASGYRIVLSASTDDRLTTLKDLAEQVADPGRIRVVTGILSAGMDLPDEKLCYISDTDIFGTGKKQRRARRRSRGQQLQSFTDLKKGDYVVHENHGIGVFLGIEQLTVMGEIKDYIRIKYAGSDQLYVPVEQMDMVQKYIGSDEAAPKINRLSGDEWRMTKARARAAIAEMTDELIELYARRQSLSGYAFGEDTVWQREFEAAFPYQETDDQLRAADEIKQDMERPVPMDRLLCGDVGYGKTEVAARAIFKCLEEGKQAAVLVPTTILASQHYKTLSDRFQSFPFTVEMLSRFRSDKEQKKTIQEVQKGTCDLVIGTHRLLSEDVKFKDLGLLVVDEEQRFGVAHKEKIKKLKANVDVLTLSATPIPRTLNMSLTGIRDMSLISEPPEERYPVQTYVLEYDDLILREVIMREIDRGGQVFCVYNRVRGIHRIAERIANLVPEARIAVGHGQMNEHALEEVMSDFIAGETNVLVATTIIESGLDIPNANTMIILNADQCGLAQLYQLRGRVGRSNRIAYCYLTYKKEKVLSETAVKRLRAIKEFTEFGSGFKIAMRDLEIRGAGNLLGAEQSGHMMSIGYDLYCKLVDDAVRRAKGESVPETREEVTVEIPVPANIPDWYIEDENLKLQAYKKIASIATRDDLDEVADELLDRYGDLPKETMNLLKISLIRELGTRLALLRIYEQKGHVILGFRKENVLSPYALMKANEIFGMRMLFHGGVEPYIRLQTDAKRKLDDSIRLLACLVEYKDKRPES